MPSIEDWINCPLGIIQGLFDGSNENHTSGVRDYFTSKLQGGDAISWVPSLNDVELHKLRNHRLVRFRCMVQDMFDPEYYLGVYEVKNKSTNETSLRCGKYLDTVNRKEGEEIDFESQRNVTLDRQTLYCVPVPGENKWVQKSYKSTSKAHIAPSTSYSTNRVKRGHEDETSDQPETEESGAMETESSNGTLQPGDKPEETKKTKIDGTKEQKKASGPPDLNFPLPGEKGPACLVKVYDDTDGFKVNDVVEFVGVLSTDPSMATFPEDKQASGDFIVDPSEMECVEEINVKSPPPSLVPRLHAVVARKLAHSNPHLPLDITADNNKQEVNNFLSSVRETREHVLSILQQSLFGDKLSAEYLLCHLLSNVYSRRDVTAVGNFSLNLSNVPKDSPYPQHLDTLIQNLVTKSYMLPMSLHNMNNFKFIPRKDYTANRLVSGILQLSDGTHLILDETALQSGQLDANGVRNITALGNVVRWQKVEYDFTYHKQDFNTNLPVLVLSEGKSMIQCNVHCPIKAVQPTENIEERFKGIDSYLTPSLLSTIQTYLSLVKMLPHEVSQELTKEIEEDFVDMRKDDPHNLTIECFHTMLTLARLLALSNGTTSLTSDLWEKAKQMETQRKCRITPSNVNAAES